MVLEQGSATPAVERPDRGNPRGTQSDSSKNRLFLITNRPLLRSGMRGMGDGGATGIFR